MQENMVGGNHFYPDYGDMITRFTDILDHVIGYSW